MSAATCPSMEDLFERLLGEDETARVHLESCSACAAIFEAHRQLEKDLLRLQDPLPPPELLLGVMARLEDRTVNGRRELGAFVGVAGSCAAVWAGLVASSSDGVGAPVSAFIHVLVQTYEALRIVTTGTLSLWHWASLPLTALIAFVLLGSLVGLRQFTRLSFAETSA